MAISKYDIVWPEGFTELDIELYFIRNGGFAIVNGVRKGVSLYYHHKQAQKLLWPEDDWHRWADLALKEICGNTITTLMGPGDAGKTYPSSKWALVEYWAAPDETLVIVSSTDTRGLELRIWGAIKDLFNRARDRYPLPGVALESLHCITTDDLDDDDEKARVLRKGIICIPCLQNGKFVGLGKYVGIKQRRIRQVADEVQLMGISFLDAVPNYLGKDYKGVFLGNPLDPMDPLGRVAEPIDGWDSQEEPQKTECWDTRFSIAGSNIVGRCVNFVGTDSPNFDFPQDLPPRYPYLIGKRKIDAVAAFWGRDSLQYYSQCKGVMKKGLLAHRVITKDICRIHRAFDKTVNWKGGPRVRVLALDAAYSGEGGDRCVGGRIEFGETVEGENIILIHEPEIVPVKLSDSRTAEHQIADWMKTYGINHEIPVDNMFYDSTGRGTLGSAFAKAFGAKTPVPIEFGGTATKRPVRHDLYVEEKKGASVVKRLKRCDEHYKKFVTELWFSVRYVIESEQMRGLPMTVCEDGCMREYGLSSGNLIEIESKVDTKKRMGKSPDLFDWLATAIEGARRLGFKIKRLGAELIEKSEDSRWLQDLADRQRELRQRHSLHSVSSQGHSRDRWRN